MEKYYDKGYRDYTPAQVLGYVFITTVYIALIAFIMVKISAWWFLALFLWNWSWNEKTD